MLTEKYSENFLELYDKANNKGEIINKIIETEKITGVELLDWDDAHIIIFLKSCESVSPVALNKKMVVLRKFANFICKKEKLPIRTYSMDDGSFLQLIDKKQLMSVTLSYEQYTHIKNQLDVTDGGETVNVRDKVIFELAWASLTNDDIRFLKVTDIEFIKSENDWDIAILNLKDRIVRIDDPEVVADIKKCIKETYSIRTAKDGRIKKTFYKDSEYLVKPINVGRTSDKTYLNEPNLALQGVFKSGNIVCSGIDIEGLSLADIRRSRLIYLLSPENTDFFDIKTVSGIYNLKTQASLSWLRNIAEELYPKVK